MEDINLSGRIISTENGSESSLIIPVGDYKIMILSDDCNGLGKGEIRRSELFVFHKNNWHADNLNRSIFGYDTVTADSETIFEAMNYCSRQLRKKFNN